MGKLERVLDPHPEMPFYVCALDNLMLRHTESGVALEAYLIRRNFVNPLPLDEDGRSTNPWIVKISNQDNPHAGFLSERLKEFEDGSDIKIADKGNPVRWVGSGGLVIVEDKRSGNNFAVINKRVNSILYPSFYDASGGLASLIKDMLIPSTLAEREILEEVEITEKGAKLELDLVPVPLKRGATVTVHFNGQVFTENNFIPTIDVKSGTIDLRRIYKISVDDLNDCIFKDGEARMSQSGQEVPLDRPVLLVSLSKLKSLKGEKIIHPDLGFKSQKPLEKLSDYGISTELLTPTLLDILKQIYELDI